MPPFVWMELLLGALSLSGAIFHIALAVRGSKRELNIAYSCLALSVTLLAFTSPLRYLPDTLPAAVLGHKISQSAIGAFGAALVWFTRAFLGWHKTRIPRLMTTLWVLLIILHFSLPYGLYYEQVDGLKVLSFPGGGEMHVVQGKPGLWLLLGNLMSLWTIGYLVTGCAALWRDKLERRKAIALSLGIAPLVLFAYPHGLLVFRGLADPPHFYTFAFLGLLAVMSNMIVGDVVRSAELSLEVQENERRWRTLLESVSLVVLGCNRRGLIEYVNPCLLETTGYRQEALLGRLFTVLFPSDDLPVIRRAWHAATEGNIGEALKTGLVSQAKQHVTVVWRSVLLHDRRGEISGVLSIGADVTDLVASEKARDEAIAQLTTLKNQLEAENQYLKLEYETPTVAAELIGDSSALRYVRYKISQVASTDATVLIEGETGVGKELVARAIHQASPRSTKPFIRVNCAALPPTLVESELFGHERGAFTGADRARRGRFELAEGGTILLDEVGELPLDIQSKLLRILQEGEFDRVGGSKTLQANVRILASTNRHLDEEVATGRFRQDLYFRLQVFPISVPPLRDRLDDIPILSQHIVRSICQKYGRPVPELSLGLIERLCRYEWPGNVRELQNVWERMIITSDEQRLTLPKDFPGSRIVSEPSDIPDGLTMDTVERMYIERTLKRTRGRIGGPAGAASILGMHHNTLRGRMKRLGMERFH